MAEPTFEETWADVTPIPQNDGPNPVVKIAYTKDFTELMDLFRGVVAKGEYSDRVLDLTEEILEINAANYTVWQYRRECLKRLKSNLNEELDYLDGFSRDNPKNYQIWHHRRTVVEWLGSGDRELDFCNEVFKVDAKNYHAWAHRQWALKTFNLWDTELAFVEKCIETDVRNNSAWNQRWYCVHMGPEIATAEVVLREVSYAWARLQTVTLNESAWNYLRGLAKTHREVAWQPVKERCEEMVERSAQQNIFALGLLADLCEDEADLLLAQGLPPPPHSSTVSGSTIADTGRHSAEEATALLRAAEGLCVKLVTQDAIRAKSWTRRVLGIRQKLSLVVG